MIVHVVSEKREESQLLQYYFKQLSSCLSSSHWSSSVPNNFDWNWYCSAIHVFDHFDWNNHLFLFALVWHLQNSISPGFTGIYNSERCWCVAPSAFRHHRMGGAAAAARGAPHASRLSLLPSWVLRSSSVESSFRRWWSSKPRLKFAMRFGAFHWPLCFIELVSWCVVTFALQLYLPPFASIFILHALLTSVPTVPFFSLWVLHLYSLVNSQCSKADRSGLEASELAVESKREPTRPWICFVFRLQRY